VTKDKDDENKHKADKNKFRVLIAGKEKKK
jgi:hypothetical protein